MPLPAFLTHPTTVGISWIVAGVLIASIAVLATRVLEAIAHAAKSRMFEQLAVRLRIPLAIILVLFGVKESLAYFGVTQQWLFNIFISLLILVGTYGVIVSMTTFIMHGLMLFVRKTKTRADDTFLPLFQGFLKLLILVIAFAWILTSWGVHIAPLIAGLGIAGLAVGLALQGTMANIIGGIALSLDETFNVGDTVHLDTGEIGEVINIGLRSTKILTEDHQLMVLPNGVLANAKIINYSLPDPSFRIVIDVGIACNSDIDKAKKAVLNAIKGIPGIKSSPEPAAHFKNIGDFSLNFQLKVFIEDYRKRHEMRSIVTQKVYEALRKAKIDVPYPTRTIYLKK